MGFFDDVLGGQSDAPSGGFFADVLSAPASFEDRFAAAPATAPEVSPGQRLLTDFQNQGMAAGQRTTPVISAQTPNLVSSDVYQSDAGDIQYKDPATGQVVPTD